MAENILATKSGSGHKAVFLVDGNKYYVRLDGALQGSGSKDKQFEYDKFLKLVSFYKM